MDKKRVFIVIPVYNESSQIRNSYLVINSNLPNELADFSFLFIDDGSSDDSWQTLSDMTLEYDNVRAIKLSRNFGKEAALCAGLENAGGDAVITMDADLQHPPSLIPKMMNMWLDDKYEIVEGVKASRGRESIINKAGAALFYYFMLKFSGVNLKNTSDFKLMDRKVIDAWKRMREHDTFLRGMSAWLGFRSVKLSFSVADRTQGKSRWSFFKLSRLAINAITSFSSLPMHLVTVMGVIFLIGSIALGIQTLYQKLSGQALDGFTTIILLLLIIGSTLMLSLGIIGSYIARIFNEVKMRPRYLISMDVSSYDHSAEDRKDPL